MRRVVITGMGAVSPLGRGADTLVESIIEGKSGIACLADLVEIAGLRSRVGGLVPEFDLGKFPENIDAVCPTCRSMQRWHARKPSIKRV